MPKISITINRSFHIVWEFITKPKNWKKWWSASLVKVEPGWQDGATLTWENGQQSNLSRVIDQEAIFISSRFMETAFLLRAVDDRTDILYSCKCLLD